MRALDCQIAGERVLIPEAAVQHISECRPEARLKSFFPWVAGMAPVEDEWLIVLDLFGRGERLVNARCAGVILTNAEQTFCWVLVIDAVRGFTETRSSNELVKIPAVQCPPDWLRMVSGPGIRVAPCIDSEAMANTLLTEPSELSA